MKQETLVISGSQIQLEKTYLAGLGSRLIQLQDVHFIYHKWLLQSGTVVTATPFPTVQTTL